MYFWKDGMAEWRPLGELPAPSGYDIVPPRRDQSPVPDMNAYASVRSWQPAPEPVRSPASPFTLAAPSPSLSLALAPAPPAPSPALPEDGYRKSNRHFFRTNPLPLTVGYQIISVIEIGLILFFLFICFEITHDTESIPELQRFALSVLLQVLLCFHMVLEVIFFFWVYFTNRNCRGFTTAMKFSSGWAVGWFFVPIFNLFRPYQVMQEIWKVSEHPRSWQDCRDSIFVGFWFALRLGIAILFRGPFHTEYDNSEDLGTQAIGVVMYCATVEGFVLVIHVATLILISVVTWRQVHWVRGED